MKTPDGKVLFGLQGYMAPKEKTSCFAFLVKPFYVSSMVN
jgi:hypothetical protein